MQQVLTAYVTRTQIPRILRAAYFGDRTRCPQCGFTRKLWPLSDDRWQCPRCYKKFTLGTDTWLARATLSWTAIYELLHWFELGLSDRTILERLELDYQQGRRVFHRLREAIVVHENQSIRVLDGEVKVDETYGGYKCRNRKRAQREPLRKTGQVQRGRGAKHLQQPVFGIYERADGIVYVKPVDDVTKETPQQIIKGKVTLDTTIYCDTWKAYHQLDQTFEAHQRVNHSQHEYVRGAVSIDGIEGFWGCLKGRLLKYHGIRPRTFMRYLKVAEFRLNHRHLTPEEFVQSLVTVLMEPVTPRNDKCPTLIYQPNQNRETTRYRYVCVKQWQGTRY